MYLFVANSFLLYLLHGVDIIVDYEALKVAQDEKIIKRCAVANNGITPAYHFRIELAIVYNIRENNTSNYNHILWMTRTFHIHSCQPSYTKQ
jgi:hypothetical protein